MIRFDGQVVIVTGAGRGLGRAYAELIASRGATVVIHDAGVALDGTGGDPKIADEVVTAIVGSGSAAEAGYEDLSSDTGCRTLVARTIEQHGRMDALVHSAGLVPRVPLEEMSSELWRHSISVNLEAACGYVRSW